MAETISPAEPLRHQSGGLAVALAKLDLDALTVAGAIESLQREIGTLRWMIGIGFTLLSVFLALSTFLQGS